MHVHFPIETQIFFVYTKLFFPSMTGSNTLLYKHSKALSCRKGFIIHFNPTASQGSRNNIDVTLQQCHHGVMSPCSDVTMSWFPHAARIQRPESHVGIGVCLECFLDPKTAHRTQGMMLMVLTKVNWQASLFLPNPQRESHVASYLQNCVVNTFNTFLGSL